LAAGTRSRYHWSSSFVPFPHAALAIPEKGLLAAKRLMVATPTP
jgi:hypothetical protein